MFDDYVLKAEDVFVIIEEINANYGDLIEKASKVKYDPKTDNLYLLIEEQWYKIAGAYNSNGEAEPEEISASEVPGLDQEQK